MKATRTTAVRVQTHGRVPNGSADLAAAKVGSLLLAVAEPVLSAWVTLAVTADPAVERPAIAQATIDVNGRIVRAGGRADDARRHRTDGSPARASKLGDTAPGGHDKGHLPRGRRTLGRTISGAESGPSATSGGRCHYECW